MIPGIDQCLALMADEGMLANIRDHSLVVAGIAEGIRVRLAENGVTVPRDLVLAGALLHDIAKTHCLEESCNHARLGAEICRERGYPEVARIVADHVFLPRVPERADAACLVYYADKRVNHDQVVSISERERYIIDKYGKGDRERVAAIRANVETWRRVEELIFNGLDLDPAALDQGFVVDILAEAGPDCRKRAAAGGLR